MEAIESLFLFFFSSIRRILRIFSDRMKRFDRPLRDTGIGDQQLQTVRGAKFPFANRVGLFNYRF